MKVLVTGGGGFVGQYIVEEHLQKGIHVRTLARHLYPELNSLGVETIQGDIQNLEDVKKAVQGCEAVFHTAAKVGIFGKFKDFYLSNVIGTQNVIEACQMLNVPKLIFTSSSSVAYHGGSQILATEEIPYPKTFLSFYSQTKAMAEQMVLASNGKNLLTCALRPHLIWGPRDKYIIPRLLEQARKRKLWIVGDGKNITDITYVENIAKAHILAWEHLHSGSPVCGQVYYITQGKPVVMWEWINDILQKLNLPKVEKHIPFKVAYGLGFSLEKIFSLFHFPGEPPLTRLIACQLATSHTYSIAKAQKDFGYRPFISTEEGLVKLFSYLSLK